MATVVSSGPLSSQFDEFLLAPLGEDKNGARLSVLSSLARSDLDPWEEAFQLSGLPSATAIARLASVIAAQPEACGGQSDAETTAARLILLLPRRTKVAPDVGFQSIGKVVKSKTWIYVLILVVAIGAQWILAAGRSPERIDNVHAQPPSERVLPSSE